MRSNFARAGMSAMAGGLLILAGTAPLPIGDDNRGPVQIVASKMVRGVGEVTVVNPTRVPQTGKVVARVSHDGVDALVLAPFTVWGGKRALVPIALPPGSIIIEVGIIVDDGAPF